MGEFVLTDEIKSLGISKVVTTTDYLYVYNNDRFVRSIFYGEKELETTLHDLEERMIDSNAFGDQKAVEKKIFLISEMWVKSIEETSQAKEEKEKEEESKSQVFRSRSILAEAILVGDRPKWLVSSYVPGDSKDVSISVEDSIDISADDQKIILKPPSRLSYVNRPYVFSSEKELEDLITAAGTQTLDSLYIRAKKVWQKYVTGGDLHLTICAADCIFTYFQDKIGMTHYLFFVGDNDSGKSSNLHVINLMAYRNMYSTDVTAPNVYSFLGFEYEGIGTLCEDEADNVDEDRDKMRVYNNGYTTGIRVHRLDTNGRDGRQQDAFYTFGFKAFAAERRPHSIRAKGFNQRVIEIPCTYGIPKHDILEVVNNAGDQIDEDLLNELSDLRNSLIIFRLLHYQERIPNIRTLNLQNREKQLFKPLLRVFQNTETIKNLEPVVATFLSQKREAKSHTHTAFLVELITALVERNQSYTLETSVIWHGYMDGLPDGELIGKLTYNSQEYGQVSQKGLIEMLKDQFDARPPKHTGNKRQLVFDKDTLRRMKNKYSLKVDITSLIGSSETLETDESDDGLDKHFLEENGKGKSSITKHDEPNSFLKLGEKSRDPLSNMNNTSYLDNNIPSQMTHLSHESSRKQRHELLWVNNIGLWGCKNCSLKTDKFGMDDTSCKGGNK